MVHSKSITRLGILVGLLCVVFFAWLAYTSPVSALAGEVVIAKVQVAGSTAGTSAEEFISLYNNTDHDINVTGWCLTYNVAKVACVSGQNPRTEVYLAARSTLLAMNPTLEAIIKTSLPAFRADIVFSSASNVLAATNGSLGVIDMNGTTVDLLGWGTGDASTQALPANIPAGKLINRSVLTGNILKDTANNSADFELTPLDGVYLGGGLYEIEKFDACVNTSEIELTVPEGFVTDGQGNCIQDMCGNIAGVQVVTPIGYQADGDTCTLIKIQITEVLPNVAGTDTGREFIELYNPNSFDVDLTDYAVQLGSSTKKYVFPQSTSLPSNAYIAFSDTQTGIVLPNTSASVRLLAPDGTLLHETNPYSNPKDDATWVLVNGTWQYTTIATPGAPNELAQEEVSGFGAATAENLEDCPEGKTRNPATNRCKNIETVSSALNPCAANQERNLVTNRCRKIATSTASNLAPCDKDQQRNPATNRCKKIETASATLKQCAEGQERNPSTNRCRKVGSSVTGDGLEATTENTLPSGFKYRYPVIGLLLTGLIGYGAYEYRTDIKNYAHNIKSKHRRGRPPG